MGGAARAGRAVATTVATVEAAAAALLLLLLLDARALLGPLRETLKARALVGPLREIPANADAGTPLLPLAALLLALLMASRCSGERAGPDDDADEEDDEEALAGIAAAPARVSLSTREAVDAKPPPCEPPNPASPPPLVWSWHAESPS